MSLMRPRLQGIEAAKERLLLFAALIAVIAAWEGPAVCGVENSGRDADAMLTQAGLPMVVGVPMQHDSYIFSAQFSPDGRRVVTASKDGTARLWDAATGDPVGEPMQSNEAVYAAEFSPDGKRVVTASAWDARVWVAVSGKPISGMLQKSAAQRPRKPRCFSHDSRRIRSQNNALQSLHGRLWNNI
jgi:WD domain, G-beta repeat